MKLFTVASSTPSPRGEGWGEAVKLNFNCLFILLDNNGMK